MALVPWSVLTITASAQNPPSRDLPVPPPPLPHPELLFHIPPRGLSGWLGTEGSLHPDTPVPLSLCTSLMAAATPDMSCLSVHPPSCQHPLYKGKAAARGQSTCLGGAWSRKSH